jgi:hypothetical protein
MADYREALQALSRAPLANFVAERKRLATGLRAAGDEDAAKQLAQRRRPTASAWTVNQLYWHARGSFDALLAAAAQLRKGDLSQTTAYREALSELRKRADAVLRDAGHAATAATLRRVMGTLAAVAAAGGFDPDPPGALAADREPPGFDAVDASASTSPHQPHHASQKQGATVVRTEASRRERLAAARAEDQARKQAETKARERHRLETALGGANAQVRARERALSLLQKELQAAEKAVKDARQAVRDLERKVEGLDDAD